MDMHPDIQTDTSRAAESVSHMDVYSCTYQRHFHERTRRHKVAIPNQYLREHSQAQVPVHLIRTHLGNSHGEISLKRFLCCSRQWLGSVLHEVLGTILVVCCGQWVNKLKKNIGTTLLIYIRLRLAKLLITCNIVLKDAMRTFLVAALNRNIIGYRPQNLLGICVLTMLCLNWVPAQSQTGVYGHVYGGFMGFSWAGFEQLEEETKPGDFIGGEGGLRFSPFQFDKEPVIYAGFQQNSDTETLPSSTYMWAGLGIADVLAPPFGIKAKFASADNDWESEAQYYSIGLGSYLAGMDLNVGTIGNRFCEDQNFWGLESWVNFPVKWFFNDYSEGAEVTIGGGAEYRNFSGVDCGKNALPTGMTQRGSVVNFWIRVGLGFSTWGL